MENAKNVIWFLATEWRQGVAHGDSRGYQQRNKKPRSGDRTMAHTFTNLLTHVIFSTKDRRPFVNANLKSRLYPYLGGIIREAEPARRAIAQRRRKRPSRVACGDLLAVMIVLSAL
jgi:hypothetical protein